MTSKGNYYITTPIYYVNDSPHIGHAYTSLACDVMARFMRLDGYKVKFLTGTDEHGQKVEKSAEKAELAPKAFTDEVSGRFRELAKRMNYSNDDFIRTTEPRHIASAQGLWNRLKENGHIYLGSYAGWYSVRDEAFYTESELVNGLAPTGAPVEWVEEPSYFFDLSKWQDKLLAFYESHPDFIAPESRRNEVIRFVEGGLKDLSVSRTSFKWGIPIPGDENHVMYVWLDALANYLSAVGYPDTEAEEYKAFWPADLHVVGKDILRFHAIYWPAFLMAADLPLPRRVVAHGWWTNEGQKISKSLGNVIDPISLVETFGLDQTRYFLMREVPFGNDGNFSRESMINRINSELANNIGNLVQRTLSMIAKNCDGKVPEVNIELLDGSNLSAPEKLMAGGFGILATAADKMMNEGIKSAVNYISSLADSANNAMADFAREKTGVTVTGDKVNLERVALLREAYHSIDVIRKHMQEQDFSAVLEAIIRLANQANSFIDEQAPWALKKENPAKMATVLYVLAEAIRVIGLLLQPFMPDAAAKILDQLGVADTARTMDKIAPAYALVSGAALPAPSGVFPRYVEE